MFTKSYKLYPVSETKRVAIGSYADKLFDMSEQAEAKGDYEKADKLFSESCKVGAILHQMDLTSDGKVAWIKGFQIALVKRAIA